MRIIPIVFIAFIFLCGCGSPQKCIDKYNKENTATNCTKEDAISNAALILHKMKYGVGLLQPVVIETSELYVVAYKDVEYQIAPPGPVIKFSKKNCRIVSYKLHQ